MLYLIVEKEFTSYPWCVKILAGIEAEVKRKRANLRKVESISEIAEGTEPPAVVLVGATTLWLKRYIAEANKHNVHPILVGNWQQNAANLPCSLVSLDIPGSMQHAIDYLSSLGCSRTALYGVNPHAASDTWRADVFRRTTGQESHIYYNHGSLKETFDSFFCRLEEYDSVICALDYAAVSLVKRLQATRPDVLEKLCIISYGDLFLTRTITPSITSISDQYDQFGKSVFAIYNMLLRDEAISSATIMIHSKMYIRDTTRNMPAKAAMPGQFTLGDGENTFYREKEITEMAQVELMLSQCDETDYEILQFLTQDNVYATIAGQCFVSESTVKYRIREMSRICGIDTRADLVALLKKYI